MNLQCHACGKKFRSALAEARHRHNFPALCNTNSRRWLEFQAEIAQDQVAKMKKALVRIGEPKAFFRPTSRVDPEAYARMIFADMIVAGRDFDSAEAEAERKTQDRYATR